MTDAPRAIAFGFFLIVASAALTALLIVVLKPLLQRYALARPNGRSSHTAPTPQGGGMAVITASISVASLAMFWTESGTLSLATTLLAAALLAGVGAADDIWNLNIGLRLALQAGASAIVITALPPELHMMPFIPWWIERLLLGIAMLWFVNLTNFMDGIDWMTVAEVIPISAAIGVLWFIGAVPLPATLVALALGGAMLGFAPFNKPVARLFLGDVGSLPIGLLLCWLLILLAGRGHLAAAALLPLYYVADATITLLRRTSRRELVWEAHRSHFYQHALDRGFTVMEIVTRVFAVNVVLGVLAIATVLVPGATDAWIALACGFVLVGWLLNSFARGKR